MVHLWLEDEDARVLRSALSAYRPGLLRDVEACWCEKMRLRTRRDYLSAHPEAMHDEEEGFLEGYRLAQQVEDDRIGITERLLERVHFLLEALHSN